MRISPSPEYPSCPQLHHRWNPCSPTMHPQAPESQKPTNCSLFARKPSASTKALLRQIIASTPAIYLIALNYRKSGFLRITCLLMPTHLRRQYGKVTMAMKDENARRMMAAWPPPTPIDMFFQQREDVVYFANAMQEPLVDTAVARNGLLHRSLPRLMSS